MAGSARYTTSRSWQCLLPGFQLCRQVFKFFRCVPFGKPPSFTAFRTVRTTAPRRNKVDGEMYEAQHDARTPVPNRPFSYGEPTIDTMLVRRYHVLPSYCDFDTVRSGKIKDSIILRPVIEDKTQGDLIELGPDRQRPRPGPGRWTIW